MKRKRYRVGLKMEEVRKEEVEGKEKEWSENEGCDYF